MVLRYHVRVDLKAKQANQQKKAGHLAELEKGKDSRDQLFCNVHANNHQFLGSDDEEDSDENFQGKTPFSKMLLTGKKSALVKKEISSLRKAMFLVGLGIFVLCLGVILTIMHFRWIYVEKVKIREEAHKNKESVDFQLTQAVKAQLNSSITFSENPSGQEDHNDMEVPELLDLQITEKLNDQAASKNFFDNQPTLESIIASTPELLEKLHDISQKIKENNAVSTTAFGLLNGAPSDENDNEVIKKKERENLNQTARDQNIYQKETNAKPQKIDQFESLSSLSLIIATHQDPMEMTKNAQKDYLYNHMLKLFGPMFLGTGILIVICGTVWMPVIRERIKKIQKEQELSRKF